MSWWQQARQGRAGIWWCLPWLVASYMVLQSSHFRDEMTSAWIINIVKTSLIDFFIKDYSGNSELSTYVILMEMKCYSWRNELVSWNLRSKLTRFWSELNRNLSSFQSQSDEFAEQSQHGEQAGASNLLQRPHGGAQLQSGQEDRVR